MTIRVFVSDSWTATLTAHTLCSEWSHRCPSCARRYEQRSDVPHHRRGHDGAQPAGPGFKEEVYERALAAELREREIPCETQYRVDVQDAGGVAEWLLCLAQPAAERARDGQPRAEGNDPEGLG